jgi:predicted RNase H-like nuclease (RuvC/YqgF family)
VTPAGPSTDELLQALSREQALRREAEGKLSDTSREVEELSVSLFEQANEMVATERRARAKLEERVGMLEKRDAEKKRRLERLESAMDRIDRVRLLLGVSGAEGGETGVEKGGYRTPARASV